MSGLKTDAFSDLDDVVVDTTFSPSPGHVEVLSRPNIYSESRIRTIVSFGGVVVSTQPETRTCRQTQGGIEVAGIRYDGFYCVVSPDGRWVLFERLVGQVPAVPGSNYLVAESEMWALELATQQTRLLQAGLIGCGGCDGRFGPRFSATGRYAYFAETGGEGRVWLADLETAASLEISRGQSANDISREPAFSPVDDVIVYVDSGQRTIVEDLPTGQRRQLSSQGWIGRFDGSGKLVYLVDGDPKQGQRTHVYSLETAQAPATLDGAPGGVPYWLQEKPARVVARGGSFVAALEGVPGCDGTGVFLGPGMPACVEGVGASISPDGRTVALARPSGFTGQVQYPGGGSVSLVTYDIVLYGVGVGTKQVVATGAISSDQVPPVIVWNEDSTHFLVRWPLHPGL